VTKSPELEVALDAVTSRTEDDLRETIIDARDNPSILVKSFDVAFPPKPAGARMYEPELDADA
jgi:hypothetical protein